MDAIQMDEREPMVDEQHDSVASHVDATKVVPVAESIRYRRRAQSAEKKAQDLAEQLTEANERITRMSEDLDRLQLDQKLTRKLTAAGVVDLEAAVLLAKARTQGKAGADVDSCIEQLKNEKHYLFGSSQEAARSRRTTGAKDRVTYSQTALERAATRAARTGHRTDLQEYLKLRRRLL